MSPAAFETPDKMSGGPTGKMPVLQQPRIFGKGKGKSNVPCTACTVRASQAERDFSFQPDTGSANFRCREFTFRCHRLGNSGGKWPADHAHGFAQGLRSRWFRFLHELPKRKGPAPGKKSASGFGHSLEGT